MTYSESQSQTSFRPVDYNDLDLTFSQESYSHYDARQNGDDFKLTLHSIDDNELDDFRRSLVTPMSINNIQDPMYAEFERANIQSKQISNKRHQTLSPTNSYADSVTDSLAVFNRLLDDQKSSDDFLAGDLNDFMSPFNMEDLISLPPSSSPHTNHRSNITSTYQTKQNVPLNQTDNTKTNTTSYNKPRKSSVDASVQTTIALPRRTSSKERLEAKYGIKTKPEQQPTRKLQPKQQEDEKRWSSYLPDKKSTIKLSQLSGRNKLSATTATTASQAEPRFVSEGRAPTLSEVKKLPLKKRNSLLISKPSKDPASTTTISSRLRKPAINSSTLPSTSTQFKKPVVDNSSAVPATSTPRVLQRSNPNRMSWNDSSSYQKETAKQQQEKSNMYLQRRLSLMTGNKEQTTTPAKTSSPSHDTLAPIDNVDTNHVQKHEISPVRKSYTLRKQVSSSDIPVPNTTTSKIPAPNAAVSAIPTSTTSSLLRRARSLTAPSSKYVSNTDQTQKPSLMPVPTFRHRKYSGNNLSKYASVPEEGVLVSPLQPTPSGKSNTSSSHSEDLDCDPATPPNSYPGLSNMYYERRKLFTKEPANIIQLNKFGSYLTKMKDTYEVDIKPKKYTRQRVLSEDNKQYKEQKRKSVTKSARAVLAEVQERRAKTAVILNSIHYD